MIIEDDDFESKNANAFNEFEARITEASQEAKLNENLVPFFELAELIMRKSEGEQRPFASEDDTKKFYGYNDVFDTALGDKIYAKHLPAANNLYITLQQALTQDNPTDTNIIEMKNTLYEHPNPDEAFKALAKPGNDAYALQFMTTVNKNPQAAANMLNQENPFYAKLFEHDAAISDNMKYKTIVAKTIGKNSEELKPFTPRTLHITDQFFPGLPLKQLKTQQMVISGQTNPKTGLPTTNLNAMDLRGAYIGKLETHGNVSLKSLKLDKSTFIKELNLSPETIIDPKTAKSLVDIVEKSKVEEAIKNISQIEQTTQQPLTPKEITELAQNCNTKPPVLAEASTETTVNPTNLIDMYKQLRSHINEVTTNLEPDQKKKIADDIQHMNDILGTPDDNQTEQPTF